MRDSRIRKYFEQTDISVEIEYNRTEHQNTQSILVQWNGTIDQKSVKSKHGLLEWR